MSPSRVLGSPGLVVSPHRNQAGHVLSSHNLQLQQRSGVLQGCFALINDLELDPTSAASSSFAAGISRGFRVQACCQGCLRLLRCLFRAHTKAKTPSSPTEHYSALPRTDTRQKPDAIAKWNILLKIS